MGLIIRREAAENDIKDILRFIAADRPSAALDWLIALEKALAVLSDRPHIGVRRWELGSGIFMHALRNYNIYYLQVGNGIEVVRVLHCARDIGALL